jgi:hypothetical protein
MEGFMLNHPLTMDGYMAISSAGLIIAENE